MGWADDLYEHGYTSYHGGELKDHFYDVDEYREYQTYSPFNGDIFGPDRKLYYIAKVQEDGLFLNKIPRNHLDYEVCVEAVKENAWALRYVPLAWRGESISLLAVRNNPTSLQYVPTETLTAKIIAIATSTRRHTDIDDHYPTQHCNISLADCIPSTLAACSPDLLGYHNDLNVEYPSLKQLIDLFEIWYSDPDISEESIFMALDEAPESIKKTKEFKYLFGLLLPNGIGDTYNTYVYYHDNYEKTKLGKPLADYLKTKFEIQERFPGSAFGDICPGSDVCDSRKWLENQLYVKRDVHLSRFSKEDITESICLRVISKDGSQIRYVPPHLLTEAMCWLAVISPYNTLNTTYGSIDNKKLNLQEEETVLDYIPNTYVSCDLCLLALKKDPKAIFAFKDDLINEDIAIEAISRLGAANEAFFKRVNKLFWTKAVCEIALRNNIGILHYLPNNMISEQDVLKYTESGHNLALIDESLISSTVFEFLIKSDVDYERFKESMENISPSLLNDIDFTSLIKFLIRTNNISRFAWLPEEFRTLELSLLITRYDKSYAKYVPQKISIKHPFLLATKHKDFIVLDPYPEPDDFERLFSGWIEDESIDREDLKFCIENAPDKIKESEAWKRVVGLF